MTPRGKYWGFIRVSNDVYCLTTIQARPLARSASDVEIEKVQVFPKVNLRQFKISYLDMKDIFI